MDVIVIHSARSTGPSPEVDLVERRHVFREHSQVPIGTGFRISSIHRALGASDRSRVRAGALSVAVKPQRRRNDAVSESECVDRGIRYR